MWSMWDAPSDRDYYDQFAGPEDNPADEEEPELCLHCNDWPCRCLREQEEMEHGDDFPTERDCPL